MIQFQINVMNMATGCLMLWPLRDSWRQSQPGHIPYPENASQPNQGLSRQSVFGLRSGFCTVLEFSLTPVAGGKGEGCGLYNNLVDNTHSCRVTPPLLYLTCITYISTGHTSRCVCGPQNAMPLSRNVGDTTRHFVVHAENIVI